MNGDHRGVRTMQIPPFLAAAVVTVLEHAWTGREVMCEGGGPRGRVGGEQLAPV